mmetsp:Transcript_29016/g.46607  ORF Transcript_29016/g.46607 Transcript_29016/m.46607 type:complete len:170 (-) Transcript_29016:347-856(-)
MRTFAFLIRDNIVAKYALAPQLSCADLRRMSKDMLAALEPGSNDCFVIKLATFPKKSNRPSSFVSYTANQILPCFFINNGSSSSPVRCTDRSLLPPLLLLLLLLLLLICIIILGIDLRQTHRCYWRGNRGMFYRLSFGVTWSQRHCDRKEKGWSCSIRESRWISGTQLG